MQVRCAEGIEVAYVKGLSGPGLFDGIQTMLSFARMEEVPKILVFDQPRPGHHRRLVEVLCAALKAEPLLAPIGTAWRHLIAWRGVVICNSGGEYVAAFLVICAVRSLLLRRTVAILVRDPRERWHNGGWRRRLFDMVTRQPLVRLLTFTKPAGGAVQGNEWIYDIEWWDLTMCPLPVRKAVFPGDRNRPTILFIGDIHERKGIAFFIATAQRASQRGLPYRFVLAGDASGLAPERVADLSDAGIFILPRIDDDAVFVAFIREADWLWCCYRPDWDGSSGLFGRALQLGAKAIIRERSYLEEFQRQYGNGVAVPYGDPDRLLDALVSRDWGQAPSVAAFASFSISRLRAACGLGHEQAACL